MHLSELGFIIKSYRERNNIKQNDFADKLGITISALSKIESGKQKVDTATFIEYLKLSKEYDKFFDLDADEDTKWTKIINYSNQDGLFRKLSTFCRRYPQTTLENFKGHEVGNLIRHELPMSLLDKANLNSDEYRAYGSVGIGMWARIPWIAFLDKSVTDTVQKGIYVSVLFKGDGTGFYLSLNQGYNYFQDQYGNEAKENIKKVADYLKRELRTIDEKMRLEKIDLGVDTTLVSAYENAHIVGKYYDAYQDIDEEDFINDFQALMLTYREVSGLMKDRSYEAFIESILKYQSLDYADEIDQKNFFESLYINSSAKRPDFITEIDGKRIAFEMKTYRSKPVRNRMRALQAMEDANYTCEYNTEHETFMTNKGKPYIEAHHLIPMKEQENFDEYLDNPANILVLCPNCNKAIEMGSDDIKETMLRKLFYSRIEKLENMGIELTFSQLKKMYGIKD